MKTPRFVIVMLVGGGIVASVHVALRLLHLGVHASAIVGAPASLGSLAIGVIYVATYLFSVIVMPVLVLASLLAWGSSVARRGQST